jgi:hypothetical protein
MFSFLSEGGACPGEVSGLTALTADGHSGGVIPAG